MSNAKLSEVEQLKAEIAALKAAQSAKISLKVSPKGGLSVYGLGRWPITLYRSQWEALLDAADSIRAFIKANAGKLSVKGE